jgi:MFS family permease
LKTFREIARHPLTIPFYLPAFLFAFAEALLIPVLPLYAAEFGASYVLIGFIISGQQLGTVMADIPTGIALRHLGLRRAMLLGIGTVAAATLMLAFVQTAALAIVCQIVSGLGIALFGVSRHAFMAVSIDTQRRGRSLALFAGLNRVGFFVGPVIGGAIGATFGLRAVFPLVGLIGTVIFVLILFTLQVDERHMATTTGARSMRANLATVAREQRHILISAGVGQLFGQMIRQSRRVIIPLYAADVLGLDAQMIGLIISIAGIVDAAMFYFAGWIMDNVGRKFAIVPCFAIQGLGMALVPLTGSFWGLLLAASVINFGNGLGSGTMLTLGSDFAPDDARGEFLGMWRLIGNAGGASAPLIVGTIADLLVLPAAALSMSLAGLISASIFALTVPETLQKKARTPKPIR